MMGQRYRRGFTAAERTELWDRWQRGESLKAAVNGRPMPSEQSVHGEFVASGDPLNQDGVR
jgi:hypothetical protein